MTAVPRDQSLPVSRQERLPVSQEERLARITWARISEPGDRRAQALVARLGPVEALRAVREGDPRLERWRVRLPNVRAERDLVPTGSRAPRVLVPGDRGWPHALDCLGTAAPFCLWARGEGDPALATSRAAAVVGTRAASGYGEHVAAELGAGLADLAVTVISGAAYGVDGAAHRGVLAAGGCTIAVLASGVDRGYPRGNARLIERIAESGLVIAEVPPGAAPTRWRFLARNRLIAALATVTVVVEAAWRSGALSTAAWAARLARTVAAVPGPVTSPTSTGCHALLRDGAVCVTEAREVLELVSPIGTDLAEPVAPPQADHDGLSPDELRVFDALPLRRAVAVASLCQVAGLPEASVLACLGLLELRGLARRDGAGWLRARGRGVP